MSEKPSHSRVRIALAQFCFSRNLDITELYQALGVDPSATDAESLSHMAGVLDGMTVAANRIRQHGLDDWARDV
jgi:hypothetical protein